MAAPIPPMAMIAPGPAELAQATDDLDARIVRMSALSVAMGRLHATWGEALATGGAPAPCVDAAFGSVVARSRAFGAEYRDAVQDARAALERLRYLQGASTVAPLLDEADHAAFAKDEAAVTHHVAVYLEMSAWQDRFVEPSARGCSLALTAAPGIAWTGARAVDDPRTVAVIGLGGGYVCPGAVPADGRAAVVEGAACVSADATCACDRLPVADAAVLTSP